KELVANALHACSIRSEKPLVRVNCSAIPDNLLESTLFGHKKGAFTGAIQCEDGLLQKADGGTLLLDEIGEMNIDLQPKLLRFLETCKYRKLGSADEVHADVWILASTNALLEDMIEQDRFREDLYYRLNVLRIKLDPLRKRKQDIPLLTDEFLRQENSVIKLRKDELLSLQNYHWPGNIRQLASVIKSITIGKETIATLVKRWKSTEEDKVARFPCGLTLAELEKRYIIIKLTENDYRIRKTAQQLGISRSTLKRKLERHGIPNSWE
ncbi:hypothetical protein GF406_01075, partial [candidate division KSB1 bacterium]|nr:hypothetical protein [candidate division KSB1 bacterium]